MREIEYGKNVYVESFQEPTFKEKVDPRSGKRSFIIQGLLLPKNKISRNNVLYNWDSIRDKHKDLIGKPVMLNHVIEGEVIPKGKVVESWLEDDGWHYKADLNPKNEDVIDSVKRGDLNKVSIQLVGGKVLERVNDGGEAYTEAHVRDIIEMSLVTAPGFTDTSINMVEALRLGEDVTTTTGKGAMAPTAMLPKKKEEEAFDICEVLDEEELEEAFDEEEEEEDEEEED